MSKEGQAARDSRISSSASSGGTASLVGTRRWPSRGHCCGPDPIRTTAYLTSRGQRFRRLYADRGENDDPTGTPDQLVRSRHAEWLDSDPRNKRTMPSQCTQPSTASLWPLRRRVRDAGLRSGSRLVVWWLVRLRLTPLTTTHRNILLLTRRAGASLRHVGSAVDG